MFLYIDLESLRSTVLELEISMGSYRKLLLFFDPECKISTCVHLRKECGCTSSTDYPNEQEKSELFFGFILEVGHESNVASGILQCYQRQ